MNKRKKLALHLRWPGQGRHVVILVLLLLTLVACAPATSSTLTKGTTTPAPTQSKTDQPTPTPTGPTLNELQQGCPGTTAPAGSPVRANVIVQYTDMNHTITVHTGDLIEIRLPFGKSWRGPTAIPANLVEQQPAGYASPTDHSCIWRFVAQTSGSARLKFGAGALCLKGQFCPMYILEVVFTFKIE